jgi:peptidoglycan/LPS O-acetylase OafA/YrhL
MDGLRGYAAIAVILFHSILDRDPTQNVRIVRPTIQEVRGAYDVISKLVFMVISGETAVVTAHIAEKSVERPLIALGRKLTQFSVSPEPVV